jgi:hypothetical protein
MKSSIGQVVKKIYAATFAVVILSTTCWAGPPGTPDSFAIPTTPAGSAGISAATVVALAAYGYWKGRK